jgi:hypothetical protein
MRSLLLSFNDAQKRKLSFVDSCRVVVLLNVVNAFVVRPSGGSRETIEMIASFDQLKASNSPGQDPFCRTSLGSSEPRNRWKIPMVIGPR